MAMLVPSSQSVSSEAPVETTSTESYKAPEYEFRELNHDKLDGLVNTLFKFNKPEIKKESINKNNNDKVIRQKFLELLQMIKETP